MGPTSVRWTNTTIKSRLDAFVRHNPGMSANAAVSTLVDEGLRMREHPAIIFRDGPMGRRASLASGSDVWEIIRSLRNAAEHAPDQTSTERINLVARNAGVTDTQVNAAVAYYTAYPDEIDQIIQDANDAEEHAMEASARRNALLS